MEKMTGEYKIVTERFLHTFENYWEDALYTLDIHQAQLVAGNKLRPQMALWGYMATVSEYQVEKLVFNEIAAVSVSIELIHKASLLIDDWIDEDNERHGLPAFHVEYGSQQTVLRALNMIGFALDRLEGVFSDTVVLPHHYHLCLNSLIKTIYSMSRGALEELCLDADSVFEHSKIREIAQLETAEIIGNSMLIGYYTGTDKINSSVEQLFKLLGDKCGYLFQLYNDLEAFENPQKLINNKGSLNIDLNKNRKNLVISSLNHVANGADQNLLHSAGADELFRLINKYRIISTLRSEAQIVFEELITQTAMLQSCGLSSSWCNGFCSFLTYVKQLAEDRLK